MYTQRTRRPDQSFQPTSRWWTPVVTDADGARLPVDPRAGDAYVVVDEVLEGRVRLVVAPWPRLDREGGCTLPTLAIGVARTQSGPCRPWSTATGPGTARCCGRCGSATRSWFVAIPAGWLAGRRWWT